MHSHLYTFLHTTDANMPSHTCESVRMHIHTHTHTLTHTHTHTHCWTHTYTAYHQELTARVKFIKAAETLMMLIFPHLNRQRKGNLNMKIFKIFWIFQIFVKVIVVKSNCSLSLSLWCKTYRHILCHVYLPCFVLVCVALLFQND